MPDVKVLIAASDDFSFAERGDVVEVVPSTHDWGSATVSPDWVRLTITGVPGATQQAAEDLIRKRLESWEKGFEYGEINGAAEGRQRYGVQAIPELANDFDLSTKLQIRDRIINRFGGTLVNQGATFFTFDADPGIPLDEIGFELGQIAYRRYRFSDALIDQALAQVSPGEAAEFTRNATWVTNNIIDKLKS
jgi:hypothetical protein